jgi:hypothetical protein
MSEQTTKNFWSVIQSFEWPEPDPISYRLYHDDQGRPLIYTMEKLPGTYIEVDQPTYQRACYHAVVKQGRLIISRPAVQVSRLAPDQESGVCCDPRDVCVIVKQDQSHRKWRKITNDID